MYGLEKFILKYLGFFPVEKNKMKYSFIGIFCTVWTIIQSLTMFIEMASVPDLARMVDIMFFASTQAALLSKIFNLALKKYNLLKLEKYIKSSFVSENTNITNGAIKRLKIVAYAFRSGCFLTILLWGVSAGMNFKLPAAGWYPFDQKRYYWVSKFIYYCVACNIFK